MVRVEDTLTKSNLEEIVLALPFNVIGIVIDKRDFDFIVRTIELESYPILLDSHHNSVIAIAKSKREFQFLGKRILSS